MAGIKSSAELQEIVLSTIVKDSYILPKIIRFLNDDFFVKYSYKLIFKSLNYYYEKYSKQPSLQELLVVINDFHKPEFGDVDLIKQECVSLYNTPRYDESFVIDKLTTFVRRNNVEKVFKDLLPQVQAGSEIAIDAIGERLVEGLSFRIGRSVSFKLGDLEALPSARKDSVGSDTDPVIIKSFVEPINRALQFKGYKPGDVIMVVAEPGCGKTFYLVNEGMNAANQGFNVLHLFIGDMKNYDGFIRYVSCYTGILQDDIVSMSVEEQADLVRQNNFNGVFNRIVTADYASGQITSEEMIQEVKNIQDTQHIHFDMILVDYADNLISASDNMYKSGGSIYDNLSLLAGTNHSVILVGSQPKIEFWGEEIIPKKGAAESSKKQQIVDMMITMGKASKTAHIGTIFLPKVRRGEEGGIIRWKSYYERAKLEIISEQEYLKEKANL